MCDNDVESSAHHSLRTRRCTRYTSEEIRRIVEESNSENEDEPHIASDDENYIPNADRSTAEESGIEQEMVIEQGEEYDSEESIEDDLSRSFENIWVSKDKTEWRSNPLPCSQVRSRNILRQMGGPANFINLFTPKEVFKSIIRESCVVCEQPVCDEHSSSKTTCITCEN